MKKFKQARRVLKPTLKREIAALKSIANYKKPERVVVHLGNVGDISSSGFAAKTDSYSSRFPETKFIGIDSSFLSLKSKRNNWQQMKTTFNAGLRKLKDNSVDIISSELALGYYDSKTTETTNAGQGNFKRYTKTTINTAFKKLKSNGKLQLAVTGSVVLNVLEALKKAGFQEKKAVMYELSGSELNRTFWFKEHKKIPIYQIIVVK